MNKTILRLATKGKMYVDILWTHVYIVSLNYLQMIDIMCYKV